MKLSPSLPTGRRNTWKKFRVTNQSSAKGLQHQKHSQLQEDLVAKVAVELKVSEVEVEVEAEDAEEGSFQKPSRRTSLPPPKSPPRKAKRKPSPTIKMNNRPRRKTKTPKNPR
jgi:hypothetical protein